MPSEDGRDGASLGRDQKRRRVDDSSSSQSLAAVAPMWPTGDAGSLSAQSMRARDVHWNAQCRRVFHLLKAAWEDNDDEEHKRNALWRVADNEDALWLTVVWVQHDEHDVVVDISEDVFEMQRKCDGKKHALVTKCTTKSVNVNVTAGFYHSGLLIGCSSLTAVDLSALSNMTVIEKNFLRTCSSLTALDLSPLSNVNTVKESFLLGCSSLTALDLRSLRNVTTIEHGFLSDCSSLTAVDLSPFSDVTEVASDFLNGCSSLTAVDLSPLSNVTTIKHGFLSDCSSLTAVDLSPFSDVTEVDSGFLNGCSSLTAVDLSPLSNVTLRKGSFLEGCPSLAVVRVSGLPADSPLRPIGK